MTKKGASIDVAVVLFFKKSEIPDQIPIRDCSMPILHHIPGFITGLSGQSSLVGMMHARKYADEKKREMIVVDLTVEVTKPLYPKILGIDQLENVDLLNLNRTSRELIQIIGEHWHEWLSEDSKRGDPRNPKEAEMIARRPDLLPRLLRLPAFSHVKVVTHPVMTQFHTLPLTATSFPSDYKRIVSARARLHPDIEIVL
uniref:hypothetical protein n=1 Tax=Cupriavidus gilardii TaxID=82541 RepID=UPI002479F4BE|nr:hypothetical protein [Cupriavidus gilardii]WDE72575.1 hypothetical protein [Cupriavidus gilardii]